MNKQLNFSTLKKALKDIENQTAYYAGGTLCIDFEDMACVGLNLNGRGFTYHPNATANLRRNILLPKDMVQLVRDIYLKHKGRTEHYEQNERTSI